MNSRALILSGLIAGALMAFFSETPIFNFVNCLLCAWLWLGGILAVWLYRRFARENPSLSVVQGLGVGAVAGLIGAVIGAVLALLYAPIYLGFMKQLLASIDPSITGMLDNLPGMGVANFLTDLIENLFSYTIFGAIGGLIATALIWKAPKAPTSLQPPTPPSA